MGNLQYIAKLGAMERQKGVDKNTGFSLFYTDVRSLLLRLLSFSFLQREDRVFCQKSILASKREGRGGGECKTYLVVWSIRLSIRDQ